MCVEESRWRINRRLWARKAASDSLLDRTFNSFTTLPACILSLEHMIRPGRNKLPPWNIKTKAYLLLLHVCCTFLQTRDLRQPLQSLPFVRSPLYVLSDVSTPIYSSHQLIKKSPSVFSPAHFTWLNSLTPFHPSSTYVIPTTCRKACEVAGGKSGRGCLALLTGWQWCGQQSYFQYSSPSPFRFQLPSVSL